MIRRALVALDGSPNAEAAVTLAIDWARRFDAELVGLGVLDEPSITKPEAVSLGATGFKRERDEHRLADAHQRVLVFLAKFDARCRLEGVGCTVLEDAGRPDEQIVREAQSCDVVILGREENFHFETEERDDETLGRVLRTSPRPVVVVPEAPASGNGVLVAYGGGREVARTLQSFTLLGLAAGETLDVVAIHPDREEGERRLRPAGEYLTAHGLPHRLRPVVSEAPAADVILDEVRRLAPRLLVMGAHAHHPLRALRHLGGAGGPERDARSRLRRGVGNGSRGAAPPHRGGSATPSVLNIGMERTGNIRRRMWHGPCADGSTRSDGASHGGT